MRWKIIFAVALLLIIAGLAWWQQQPNTVEVSVITLSRGTVEQTVANTRAGTVNACRRARISPSSSGQIQQLNVHEGDKVNRGDLLLELWNKDVHAAIDLANSELVTQEARRVEACVNADVAARDLQRLQPLNARGVIANGDLDLARGKADTTRAACNAAKAALDTAKKHIASATIELERSRLYAPFAGIVAEVNGEVGEFLTPSPPGIATPPAIDLIDSSCLYVSAPIDEVDASKITLGQTARITLDAFRDQEFAGRVKRIAPYVLDMEKQARTVEIEVAFLDSEHIDQLLPGYSADVEIILQSHEQVLRLPSEVILPDHAVYMLVDNHIQRQSIETGLSNWQYTEVSAGLHEGDIIVRSLDAAHLSDGAIAKIKPAQ